MLAEGGGYESRANYHSHDPHSHQLIVSAGSASTAFFTWEILAITASIWRRSSASLRSFINSFSKQHVSIVSECQRRSLSTTTARLRSRASSRFTIWKESRSIWRDEPPSVCAAAGSRRTSRFATARTAVQGSNRCVLRGSCRHRSRKSDNPLARSSISFPLRAPLFLYDRTAANESGPLLQLDRTPEVRITARAFSVSSMIWLAAGAIDLLYQPIKLWLFGGR